MKEWEIMSGKVTSGRRKGKRLRPDILGGRREGSKKEASTLNQGVKGREKGRDMRG